jgi:hypothetical protein
MQLPTHSPRRVPRMTSPGDIMITSTPQRRKAEADVPGWTAKGRVTPYSGREDPALRRLAVAAVAAFTLALGTACASTAPSAHVAVAASPRSPAAAQRPVTGTSHAAKTAAAAPAPPASQPALVSGYAGPHFDTPQAAMTYLAAAYNSDDITALHHVTEPRAFSRLMGMRSDAVNLRLESCKANARGDYTCYFRHDFPASEHKSGHGEAVFISAPALNPGWYMYQFQSCD